MSRRHDHDAGGDAEVLAAKAALRDEVWTALDVPGIRRFPGPRNRIPNFVGSEAAAKVLRATPEWLAATTVKSNPDSPQWSARTHALQDGKLVYMAVPRLAEEDPFFVLDPTRLSGSPREAASIKGASASATTIAVADLEPVDLILTGCVAVGLDGARLGKGGGFADLEYALAWTAGMVDDRTIICTTVHDDQVLPAGAIPMTSHDQHVDLIVTPTRTIRCPRPKRRPAPRIEWDQLTDEKISSIPLLGHLRSGS